MAIDNPRDKHSDSNETLKPMILLDIACTNVIDQKGIYSESSSSKEIYKAAWSDDERNLRFVLERREESLPVGYVVYTLDVYEQFPLDIWQEAHAYDVYFKEVKKYEKKSDAIGRKCNNSIPTILEYLPRGTELSPHDADIFLDVIAYDPLEEPSRITKARWFALRVFSTLRRSN